MKKVLKKITRDNNGKTVLKTLERQTISNHVKEHIYRVDDKGMVSINLREFIRQRAYC